MLQWVWVYKYLFKSLFAVLLDIYPELGLLDHMLILCWISLFPQWLYNFTFLSVFHSVLQFLHILTNACHFLFPLLLISCITVICLLQLTNIATLLPSEVHQFSSVAQSCPTLCDPMDHSTPALPVHHKLPEFTQTHVHWLSDAIQPSHPLLSPSPPALKLSQHQGLFQWVSSLHQVAKVLEFQPQHQSFQWTPRTDLL